ncbi:hypothetical protein WG68_08310 [Arsukibacterium ikkense]|uniref:Lantibiotic dehydratase n=1 Tax=Arsukibacterium ikkense TaxID=336831 RepID=A0A0M2V4Z9_9GAMM|nr:lantibiotic dehydratase [Arsukibacterium ikkense]KKO45711.1 hypothetical protein WG68_08310 [Arsukibacterium ikkense]
MSSKTECKAEFFVVRVPRLSLEKICNLPSADEALNDYLTSWLATPGIQEAIYLASPSLIERLPVWRDKPESKSGRKVTSALLKYLIRMSSRPTPFGLFSGVASGTLATVTNIKPAYLQHYSRKTRLDMFYLGTIQQQLTISPVGKKRLNYLPNSTLYQLGSHLNYIEPYQSSAQRYYRLSTVEFDDALQTMLELAKNGVRQHDLVLQFCQRYPDVIKEDVVEYVDQLVQEHVLVADLKLPLTSGQPDQTFVHSLLNSGWRKESDELQSVLLRLADFDRRDVEPEEYRAICQQLKQLPYQVSENKLFQTDLYKLLTEAQLDESILSDIERTLLVLTSLTPPSKSMFQEFINNFQRRFEGRFMPLMQLLDEEAGISFSADTGYETPLLAGINIASPQRNAQSQSQSELEQQVLKAMQQQAGAECIYMNSDVFLKHADIPGLWQQLPASFAVNISCYQDKKGQPLLHFHGCSGPSGANLLGRFCHLNKKLEEQVRDYLAAEEALSPEVIFAEVVHMPDGRPGNIIARPSLRKYEIVFLADTMLPKERQIPVQDLYVFIEAGHVKLWSKVLNKQVIPRLTSAHNYSARSLGVYRFLCMLQHQQGQLPHFSNPANFSQMESQPRVQLDHIILQEAQWLVDRGMLEALVANKKWQSAGWQELEVRYKLQRYVCYAIRDNVLTIDLHNPAMIELLLGETMGQKQVLLKESLAMQYQSIVENEEGAFAHEILVPMLNAKAKPFVTIHQNPEKQLETSIQRHFSPGSEWLSLKVYAAQSTAELVLTESIAPFLQRCQEQGLILHWFFIRYGDPDWHLRLRLCGKPTVLTGQVLPLLQKQLAPWLDSQRVSKMEAFTYQREVERYGGDNGIALAERVFQADSSLVLKSLSLLRQHGESVRWRMALLGVDAMLTAFGYDLAQKLTLISDLRQGFGQEFQEHAQLRNQLGKKYRDYQALLRQDFKALDSSSNEQPLQQMLMIREQLLQQLQPIVSEILDLQQQGQLSCTLDFLLHSLLHMFNNRIFKAYGREQEFVVYDFLRRYYLSCQSQQKMN